MGTEKDIEHLHHCRKFCWIGWTKGRSTNTAAPWQAVPLLHRRGQHNASWALLPCHLRSWTAWLCFKNKTRKKLSRDCNNLKPVNSWAAGLQEALPVCALQSPQQENLWQEAVAMPTPTSPATCTFQLRCLTSTGFSSWLQASSSTHSSGFIVTPHPPPSPDIKHPEPGGSQGWRKPLVLGEFQTSQWSMLLLRNGDMEMGDGALNSRISKGGYSSVPPGCYSPSPFVALKLVLLPYCLHNDPLKSKMPTRVALGGKRQFFWLPSLPIEGDMLMSLIWGTADKSYSR